MTIAERTFADPDRGDLDERPHLVHELLDRAVAARPDARAVTDAAGSWSYSQLEAWSRAADAWLGDLGVSAGDRVIVQLPSTRELAGLAFALWRRGAVFVPLNPQMKEFHLRAVLANAEPVIVVVADSRVPMLRELTDAPVHGASAMVAAVARHLGAVAARPRDVGPGPACVVHPTAVAALVYTSGSVASPKGVICPHAQMTFATAALQSGLRYRPEDVVFCRFPIAWDYGLYKLLLTVQVGCELVLGDEASDLQTLRRMREVGATIVPIVPSFAAMLLTLAARESGDVPPVRMFSNTGAALPQATADGLEAAFPGAVVVRQFGQTECKRISILQPEDAAPRPGSVGRPLPGTTVQIIDADGAELPTGAVGEIVVSGPHVMPGYWRAPDITARTFRLDPVTGAVRLHTGDHGSVDEDGFLYFAGRRDDMFKRKGVRMSTIEIEAAAMDVPGVRATAVLPPDDGRDLALVVEAPGLAPQAVLRELAARLEPAKVPSVCRIVDRIPLSLHGKNERAGLVALVEGRAS